MGSPNARRWWVAALVVLCAGCASGSEPTEDDRLRERLDRTAVHLHVTLRARLGGSGGEGVARELLAAPGSSSGAAALADRLFEARSEGADRLRSGRSSGAAVTPLVVEGSTLDAHTDRAAFLIALVDETVEDERRIPKQILVYEASRIDFAQVADPVVRRLARAAATLVYARAGYCERVDREVSALDASTLTEAQVRASAERWMSGSDVDVPRLSADLGHAVEVIAGGAQGCCRIRDGRHEEAARRIDGWLDDAEALEVSDIELSILRGWVALARRDEPAARQELERIRDAQLESQHAARYAMLRDALASDAPDALERTMERLVDRAWLSALVLGAAHRTFERDGALEAIGASAEGRALRRLARGEAAVLAAARERHPMFDQAHQGDQGAFERIASLFR